MFIIAFYKILKKYDKVIGTKEMEPFMDRVSKQAFVVDAPEVNKMLEIVTDLVSRNKLIEWDHFHELTQSGKDDDIFPNVKIVGLAISAGLYIAVQYLLPPISPDAVANQCFSMMILVISMWVTQALPYFATGLLIPILVTVLRVIRNPANVNILLDAQDTAVFCLNNFFSHTSVCCYTKQMSFNYIFDTSMGYVDAYLRGIYYILCIFSLSIRVTRSIFFATTIWKSSKDIPLSYNVFFVVFMYVD